VSCAFRSRICMIWVLTGGSRRDDGTSLTHKQSADDCPTRFNEGRLPRFNQVNANDRDQRCLAIGAQGPMGRIHVETPSFGKLACRIIGGAGSGTVGIEEATPRSDYPILASRLPGTRAA
jgi:hypothetical protein